MKKSHYLLLLSIALTPLFSCGKSKLCKQDAGFSGIVVQQLSMIASSKAGDVGNNQFVILTDSVYQEAFTGATSLPTIDFSMYSLLGQYGAGACNISFQKDVQANNATQTYHYKLKIYECRTFTKKLCISYNWILAPKLPQGWNVTFEKVNE